MAAVVAIAVAATTGCDVNSGFGSPMVIDNIPVNPEDWRVMLEEGRFGYFFFDVPLKEITPEVFDTGSFTTYWRYGERRDGIDVDVQELLPAVINLERFESNRWVYYTETISCNYEVGYMRVMISRSDFYDLRPDKTLYFRTVISW